jgi:hypothetical protein
VRSYQELEVTRVPHAACTHCGSTIVDHTSMVEKDGQIFCCNNCAQMMSDDEDGGRTDSKCAHCQVRIVDTSTQVDVSGETYCCRNCAAAAMQTSGRHAG